MVHATMQGDISRIILFEQLIYEEIIIKRRIWLRIAGGIRAQVENRILPDVVGILGYK